MTADGWVRVWHGTARAAELAASLMFACVFLMFVYKIAMRYAGGDAVAWADEVSVVLFVWIIFWANAFVVTDRPQITFDLVYRLLSPSARRASRIARLIVVGGLFLWALPNVIDYILFLWREVLCNLIFSGMSGSALADAAGPGLIVARMMIRDERYPAGFAA